MKTFYLPEMVSHEANSFSPSASKPGEVVALFQKMGIIQPGDLMNFEPATDDVLCLAHDPDYVKGIFAGTIENGFNNTSKDVARSTRYTVGSMVAACKYAAEHDTRVFSPTSGFHHAGYGFGGGYCTFNGLIAGAVAAKQAGLVDTVAIIDCDAHYGNGTANIIKRKKLNWIQHHTAGEEFTSRTTRYLPWLRKAVKQAERADLVIYQAGADPHVDDPLGGILTSSEMMERDLCVHLSTTGQPMVWNLAGGYQRDADGTIWPVLKLHLKTAQIMCGQYTQ